MKDSEYLDDLTVSKEEIDNQLRIALEIASLLDGREISDEEIKHWMNEGSQNGGLCGLRRYLGAKAIRNGLDHDRVVESCWGLTNAAHCLDC